MKLTLTLAALMMTSVAFAKNHTMKTVWLNNEQTGYDKIMKAGDTLTISLPWKNGSRPIAEINPSKNSLCEVISVKRVENEVKVQVRYIGEARGSDQDYNNCSVYINRNHKDDDESDGFTNLEFGSYTNSSYNREMQVKWTDQVTSFNKEMKDGDTLTIKLPWKAGSSPKAHIKNEGASSCSVLSVRKVNKEYLIKVSLDETPGDEGFNGCTVYIERNHESDGESNGTVYLEFGYFIDG